MSTTTMFYGNGLFLLNDDQTHPTWRSRPIVLCGRVLLPFVVVLSIVEWRSWRSWTVSLLGRWESSSVLSFVPFHFSTPTSLCSTVRAPLLASHSSTTPLAPGSRPRLHTVRVRPLLSYLLYRKSPSCRSPLPSFRVFSFLFVPLLPDTE